MDSPEEEYESWDVLIRKATAAKEKARRRPALQINEVDLYCPRGHRPSLQANKAHHHGMVHGQGIMKDPRQQEPKEKNFGSAPQPTNDAKSKKRKRPQYTKPRETSQSTSSPNNLEAPGATGSPKKKQKQQPNKDKHLSNIICYNCDKKGHYASKCPEPPKNMSKN